MEAALYVVSHNSSISRLLAHFLYSSIAFPPPANLVMEAGVM